ncbi:hypothetical protein IP69_05925 [Bosea sp. AAP35]|nr:hypothetical protein IP69_05925 [Bosea sp. AAP35]
MDKPEKLLALADRCETSARPDRELDAAIYEAVGYQVRRKPRTLVSNRVPAGGIYQQGSLWKALGPVSGNIDIAVSILRQKAPDWRWSLQCLTDEDNPSFHALVADCSASGMLGALALCAAMLRAFARNPTPDRVVDDIAGNPTQGFRCSRKLDP